MSLCYVTSFLDIGREDWGNRFSRDFSAYLREFEPYTALFRNANPSQYRMIVYIDERHYEELQKLCDSFEAMQLIPINEEFLYQHSPIWQTLPRETEIMQSDAYKRMMDVRTEFPEHSFPKYTLINHAKIDLIVHAMRECNFEYFCWVDFGYFKKPEWIPENLIDINKLDKQRINYTLVSKINDRDFDLFYTLQHAPEKIGGFFFCGSRNKLVDYQKLYHAMLRDFQKHNMADDDQHLALRCYFRNPGLFTLHYTGAWHVAQVYFQKSSRAVLPDPHIVEEPGVSVLCEIMNRHGSDKGAGHHNYTKVYHALFQHLREKEMNMLEIGIGTINPNIPSSMRGTPWAYQPGSSLRGWREYFGNAQIYGCDVDRDILINDERIETFHIDQTDDQSVIEALYNDKMKPVMFDVIIDDGLHMFQFNIRVLKLLYHKLLPGGIYVIEDILDYNPMLCDERFFEDCRQAGDVFEYMTIPNPKNTVDNNLFILIKH